MATTYQQHPHRTLQQFILAGEAELEHLEEPERTIRAQSLFAELQRRFQPENPIEIGDYAEPPSDTDVDDVVYQDRQDKLEEKEAEAGGYANGDEGSGEPRFVSQLKVKSVDNSKPFKQVFLRGPDVQAIGRIAAKPDDIQLVSEGEIRTDERGYLDYKPTRSYHDRVATWMFKLQCDRAAKQTLVCHFCGECFDGRKGQKYCSDDCRKHRAPRVEVREHDEYCDCDNCEKVFTLFMQLRLEYLMQKHDVEELTSGMTLDVGEKQRLEDLAAYMLKESSNEQQ